MKNLFLDFFNAGAVCSFFVVLFLLFSPLIDRFYATKWKRLVWLIVSLRLIFPVKLNALQPRIIIPVNSIELYNEGTPFIIEQAASAVHKSISILDGIAIIWMAGILISVVVYIVSYTLCRAKIVAEAKEVEDQITYSTLSAEGDILGIHRLPHILTWKKCVSPMVIGVINPLLVLPDKKYSLEELRLIFRHELNHIKCGDLVLKALIVAAKTVHWYNPIIRFMPALADVDMELSCDDEVIRDYSATVRKAYMEILFSFASDQDKRGTGISAEMFTTQFYGGKKIMKKRLSNILFKKDKQRGSILLIYAISLILVMGSVVACGETSALGSEPPLMAGEEHVVVAEPVNESESAKSERDYMQDIVYSFAKAFIDGDEATLRSCLTDSYDGNITFDYDNNMPYKLTLDGPEMLDNVISVDDGEIYPVKVTMMAVDGEGADDVHFSHLSIETVKTSEGWRVQSYSYGQGK